MMPYIHTGKHETSTLEVGSLVVRDGDLWKVCQNTPLINTDRMILLAFHEWRQPYNKYVLWTPRGDERVAVFQLPD